MAVLLKVLLPCHEKGLCRQLLSFHEHSIQQKDLMAEESISIPNGLSKDHILETVDQVFASGDYVVDYVAPELHEVPKVIPDLSFLESLLEFLGSLFKPAGEVFKAVGELSPVLFWLMVAVCAAGVLFLLYHIILAIAGVFRKKDKEVEEETPESAEEAIPVWERRAMLAAEAGDYVLALRCLLKAAIIRLEEQGRRWFKKAYTNREYLRRYLHTPAHGNLKIIVDTADAWYGGKPCNESDYHKARQAYLQLPNVQSDGEAAG